MDKFIDYLKQGAWAAAAGELDKMANSFSFRRDVPVIAQAIEDAQVGEEAYTFSVAFVLAIARRSVDGRCEKSHFVAKQLIEGGLGLQPDQVNVLREVQLKVVDNWMHPTVMQQAAQLAFFILDSNGAVPEDIKADERWWVMPLI